ncbi:YjjW family glycine radical enzyme activase [Clostridium fallax]|uniref:Glycine radical enzyme activase, YjjW family n=1 Tax=Clostridium fallax TaxID=1533 RepID=A0A1M4TXT6_9CLOT|nr:YjjW family glycine radical enzyme activase [Clostridium fallax]SHE49256.1 glycine radical enzyme activase, YjjW family [Clostridium fallax]SQB22340.1 radical SAM domain protein [Clostridium fallax]
MVQGAINKIVPFSSVDGPGNRTAIFLQGCNFNCLYCHNPETINRCINCGKCVVECPSNALKVIDGTVYWDSDLCIQCDNCIKSCPNCSSPKVKLYSSEDLINEIKKYKSFIQGITFSGGECTLQEDFLVEVFKKAKKLGLTCFVDSNGNKDFSKMNNLTNIMDMVMLDVKSWDNRYHKSIIGTNNNIVLKNLEFLTRIGKLYEVRTVVVPQLLNNEETIEEVSKFLGKNNPNIRYKLIKYRPMGVRKELINKKVPTNEYMENLKFIAEKNGCKNILIV